MKCLLRRREIVETPEEKIRQAFITFLHQHKGFPLHLMAIEASLFHERRVDLLIYRPSGDPLMLVECKAGSLNRLHEHQLFGYNVHIGAPYVALVGDTEIKIWGEPPLQEIPFFEEMILFNR